MKETTNIEELKKSILNIAKLRKNDDKETLKKELKELLEISLEKQSITAEELDEINEYIDNIEETVENDNFKKLREAAKKLNAEEYKSEKEYIKCVSKINERRENNKSMKISAEDMHMIDAIIMYKGQLRKAAPERKDDGEER